MFPFVILCSGTVSIPKMTFVESYQMKPRDMAHNTYLKLNDIMVYNINLNVIVTQTKSE